MNLLDLSVRPPRSCYEQRDGLMFMRLTIDKGLSAFLLDSIGVSPTESSAALSQAADENAVADKTDLRELHAETLAADPDLEPRLGAPTVSPLAVPSGPDGVTLTI